MDKTISLGQAFAHCASTTSYWVWIAIVLAFIAIGSFIMWKVSKTTEINGFVKIIVVFAFLAALFLSVFMRPCDVAANTSIEMAAKGHYLGY